VLSAGFKPEIPAIKRLHTYSLDRTATGDRRKMFFRMTKAKGGRREEHAEHIRQPKTAYMILDRDKLKDEIFEKT